jgi:hypothetical protein
LVAETGQSSEPLHSHHLAQLVCRDERGLALPVQIAEQRQCGFAFDLVAEDGNDRKLLRTTILWNANSVPDVTLKSFRRTWPGQRCAPLAVQQRYISQPRRGQFGLPSASCQRMRIKAALAWAVIGADGDRQIKEGRASGGRGARPG